MKRVGWYGGWLAVVLLLGLGWSRVRLDTEVLNLLPGAVPTVRGLQLYQEHFVNARELLVTVQAADAGAAEDAARQLAGVLRSAIPGVADVVWRPPWMERPEDMAALLAHVWLNQPPDVFGELTRRLAPDRLVSVAAEARDQLATSMSPTDLARLSHDPFGLTRLPEATGVDRMMFSPEEGFASADGTFRVLYVEAEGALGDYREGIRWMEGVRAAVERVARGPEWPAGAEVRFTGSPAFVAEISTGMAGDMQRTVLGTLAVIAALFGWAHRSWRPLAWMMAMILAIVAGSLAVGGLVWGTLNAVSLGFGAILAGLAVDYALVVYEETVARTGVSVAERRRALAPALTGSALTTAAAFFALNFAGLPGLSQLGTLVGVGILLTPLVMLRVFLPVVSRLPHPRATADASVPGGPPLRVSPGVRGVVTVLVAGVAFGLVWGRGIRVERDNRGIEPAHLPAQVALNELNERLNQRGDPLLLVVSGADEAEVAHRLEEVDRALAAARERGWDFETTLPTALWPHPARQEANRVAAAALAVQAPALRAAAIDAGFSADAMGFTEQVLRAWGEASGGAGGRWPNQGSFRWLLKRAAVWTGTNWLAVGAVFPEDGGTSADLAAQIDPQVAGVWLTGWSLLGGSLLEHVEGRLAWVIPGVVLLVATCLMAVFRRWREVLISLGALGLTVLVLQAVMSAAGLAWNLMSLAALPLLLGAAVDYGIHVQLALRRHAGDLRAVQRVTGRAVFLSAATTVAGFGSNSLSSHPGLAALGWASAIGIAVAYGIAVFLVPGWWLLGAAPGTRLRLEQPSATYGPAVWRLGILAARWLPRGLCRAVAVWGARVYGRLRPERLGVVETNLLPVVSGDRQAARAAARRLLVRFAVKITDLLRHESGAAESIQASSWSGYDIFASALARGRGVLLVTPHLGNWEFGGCLLSRKGVRLLVLTQPEPGRGFTELRQQARARWGIETLVVGQDAFAFVEIIRRLQDGATVALLVDRPPPRSAVDAELFGQPFRASIAPAELARASGCAIVPVYVVAEDRGYAAHVLPEIPYDRRALGDREARRAFAGEILRVFEPVLRQYPDQWYHFVPLWRSDPPGD